ncbi:MAG: TolC family protein [Campylobacterales bacterium]|nr:TolC family protein [Campylobacterales bacterium]
MRTIIVLLFCTSLIFAKNITLSEVLKSSKQHNRFIKALQKEALYLKAKDRADTASDALEIYANKIKAKPHDAPKEDEYALGLSKTIILPHIQKKEYKMRALESEAAMLEATAKIDSFHHAIKNLYHQHCIDREDYHSFQANYNDFAKLFAKKQKAYSFEEISKAELLQLKIEKNLLHAKLQEANMRQARSKKFLLMSTHLPSNRAFSCRDRYPIRSSVKLPTNALSTSKKVYQKRVEATKTAINRHSFAIDTISVSGEYSKELDTDRYTIGVSIPLNFTSSKSEAQKVAALNKLSSITLEYEESMHQKRAQISEMRAKLKSIATSIASLQESITLFHKELMPLIKKSYELGESSLIEYLLNRQKYYELRRELYESQREYYQLLFSLYATLETKE